MGCTWVANLTCWMVPLLMITDMIHPWSASNKNRPPSNTERRLLFYINFSLFRVLFNPKMIKRTEAINIFIRQWKTVLKNICGFLSMGIS